MSLSAKELNNILPLSEDPTNEVIDWLRYAADKIGMVDSIFLFNHKTESGIMLAAGVRLVPECRLKEQQEARSKLRKHCDDHGMAVLGLKEVEVLDDLTAPVVSEIGLQVYRKK